MLNSITTLFKQLIDGQDLGNHAGTDPNLAIACLLCEVAGADHQINQTETEAKLQLLTRLLNLSNEEAIALLDRAEVKSKESASLYEFTSQLRELSQETRFDLIKAMWEVAHADGEIDPLEDAVIRKTAELLYVDHSEFIRAKLQIVEGQDGQ
ncbi:TerB family tellurite resistance protein [Vibrio coralliilyticus]|uniref:tellurite resistance TerB family protein n=1 Tax=Vibrio coralliilyticus TaxID=190893 RepID=UPI002408F87F|nr:TerB family tellurite resistance protein [Vibrio coralliilyticus]WFB47074.1 TerB family tellurite resistance protein [Vibrio coralliilyticus]